MLGADELDADTDCHSVSDSAAWVYAGSASSGSIMMWIYNLHLSDSDNFGAESETSYLVTAISCHSYLDIVIVSQIVCTKMFKVLSTNKAGYT